MIVTEDDQRDAIGPDPTRIPAPLLLVGWNAVLLRDPDDLDAERAGRVMPLRRSPDGRACPTISMRL